jgi:short-subunit dehydrogenase
VSEVAVVTGASRGIGRATSLLLAQRGYRVLAAARSNAELQTLAAEAPRTGGGTIVPCVVDLADPRSIEENLTPRLAEEGPIAVLVNNAGYAMRGALEEVPLDRSRRLFEVNVWSVLHVTQKVLPGMRERRKGTIVNISSVAGVVASPLNGIYCASKFALEALSDALRMEVRRWGVRVVLIEPGPVKTSFVEAAASASDGLTDDPASPYADAYRALRDGIDSMHERDVSAEDVARVVLRTVEARRPRARYSVHRLIFHVPKLLRRLGPPALLDALLARRMGLKGRR